MKESLQAVTNPTPSQVLDDHRPDRAVRLIGWVTPLERERLVRIAYRATWNRSDAEDAVQDALVSAHQKEDQLQDSGKRWAWLCRIVLQCCFEKARRAKRRERLWRGFAEWVRGVAQEPRSSDRADIKEVVRLGIAQLSPRQQQVLILRDLEGMSYEDVAAILEVTATTARVHAKAAREALRDWININYPEMFG